jgi:nucleotide-binding universal stress UspA family protein
MAEPRYVVGFDGSSGARAALRWALSTAAHDGSDVEAVVVWQPPVAAYNPWMPAQVFDDQLLREQFRTYARDAAREVAGDAPLRLQFVTGVAGPAVVEAAAGAHCLAVGRRGHGGFTGLLMGSVADHALRHAPGAVALVPEDDALRSDGAVVAGLDGSEHSAAALRWAAAQADRLGRPLVALHAWDWLAQPGTFDPGFDHQDATRYATDIVARTLGERPVEVVAAVGRPAAALMDRSAAGDLVVVGSRGLGAVRQALVGSVSRQLAHHAPSTVVVVHVPT